jgi:hypothetical protein
MAKNEAWVPVSVPLRGPTVTNLAERYDDVKAWWSGW